MATHAARSSWRTRLWLRLISLSGLKRFVITGGITAFFIAYFVLLNTRFFPATEMPVTALDRLVAFSPQAIWLYVSLWVYVALAPALIDSRRDMLAYYLSAAAICAVGFGIFLFWPTTTPSADIDWSRYPLYQPLKAVDRGGNAFPSLHACFAVFSAVWLDRVLRRVQAAWAARLVNLAWCLGILYSTLATKQHVAVDLFAGVALGIAGSGLQWIFARRLQHHSPDLAAATGEVWHPGALLAVARVVESIDPPVGVSASSRRSDR